MNKYMGRGYYDKSDGSLIEKGPLTREVLIGEVWEGNKAAWTDTFK